MQINDRFLCSAHDDHSLAGEDVKTLPNLEYDGKGAAGYDFGDNVLNIAQVPMGNVVEPPHKHANHRGVDGGSHENGHNSGVVINGGSGEVDTSGMPNDEPSECEMRCGPSRISLAFVSCARRGWHAGLVHRGIGSVFLLLARVRVVVQLVAPPGD